MVTKDSAPSGGRFIVCLALVFLATSAIAMAQANLGTGRVSSVTALDGGCLQGPMGPAVQSWNVQQGKTYRVILSNVTECSGPQIQVLVKSSHTGNMPLTATNIGTGTYQFDVLMPTPSCFTFPILYCTQNWEPSTGWFARRPDGGRFQAHLRAAVEPRCADEDTDCTDGQPQPKVTVCKWYDTDADGLIDGGAESAISGWKVALDSTVEYTENDGCFTFAPLSPGTYTVSEVFPVPPPIWRQTGLLVGSVSQQVTGQPTAASVTVPPNGEVYFGDVCLGKGGGLTLGFWSNKNGQALFGSDDLAAMVALNLRDGAGNPFNPASYAEFRTWLLSASAANMAYMLSAQLAAMTLNVHNGFVNGSGMVYAPSLIPYGITNPLGYISVNNLIAAANIELGANGLTTAGHPSRAYQEALKNVLDALNNNQQIYVQPQPCAFISPY